MRVIVNNNVFETSAVCLSELISQLHLTPSQIAVAVDKKVISRIQWDSYRLSPDIDITIITVACGG